MKLGRLIRAATIAEAWQRGLNLIWRQGQELKDERGTRIREILALQVVVEDPRREMIPPQYSWNRDRLEEYAQQLLTGENPGFEYTYGERLRAWSLPGGPPVDQLEQAAIRLRSNPATRRATAVTWIPPVDAAKEEVPCMMVDDFKLRDGKLNLTVLFRSHDFAGAYPANLYGLTRVLEYMAGEVGAEVGSISTTSASAHIYDHDWDWVEEMLRGRPAKL
ncbi:MAG: thymidylate synthase [Methanosarcinales archaeon]|nr:thymidylate synthase [Methanosarcinales archaeon]